MSLNPYYGEITISPFPLELEGNWCSHGCTFCFANLTSPDRTFDATKVSRLLADYPRRRSAEALLLQQGYPVLISNRVDAFAHSNDTQLLPVLETMTELGIPLGFQTRGGRRLRDALRFLRPAVWYVSFAQADDALRKTLEPGAPKIHVRLEMLHELRAAGHRVVAALNPLVREWMPKDHVEALLDAFVAAGVEGVWLELIHLNAGQIEAMSERDRITISPDILVRAKRKERAAPDVAHLVWAREAAMERGLPVYTIGQGNRSDFWKPYRETYPKLFPIQQDAVDWCWDNLEDGAPLTFDDFLGAFESRYAFPRTESTRADSYLRARARGGQLLGELLREGIIRPKMTWREVMSAAFRIPRLPFSPARLRCFGMAAEIQGDEIAELRDEAGLPIYIFTRAPGGTDDYYLPVTVNDAAA